MILAMALDVWLGDVQACDPKPASRTFVKNNHRDRVRCFFSDIKSLMAGGALPCEWHTGKDGRETCARPPKVNGVVGSGSCHPYTVVATREPLYKPSDHLEYGMLFEDPASLAGLVSADDPDFWVTEQVEGFTYAPAVGGDPPIETLMASMARIVDADTGRSRYASRWRWMDQKDHIKGKRKRSASNDRVRMNSTGYLLAVRTSTPTGTELSATTCHDN